MLSRFADTWGEILSVDSEQDDAVLSKGTNFSICEGGRRTSIMDLK